MAYHDAPQTTRSLAILAIICCVLQVALAPQISVFGGRINFMLILAGVAALSEEPQTAVITAFFAGLFYDLTASVPVGLMSLLLSAGAFVLAHASGSAGGGLTPLSIQFFSIFALAVSLANGVALMILGVEGSIVAALLSHGLTSAIITAIVAIPFMMIYRGSEASHRSFSSRGGSRFKGIR